jgi:hypothetical protein
MAGQTRFNVPAVILGVFVDQIGSFALGAAIAVFTAGADEALSHGIFRDLDVRSLAQFAYEVCCLAFGVIGAFTAARMAKHAMVAHGLAVGVASLCVSTVLGIGMSQVLFDGRGIVFAVLAVLAAVVGGWFASLLPVPRRAFEHA